MTSAIKKQLAYYFLISLYGLAIVFCMKSVGVLYGSEVDWLGQHIVFPDMFRQSFYESKQLIPNFFYQIGGGQNAFNFTYYGLLSPVILLSYLLPFVDMTTYMICASICLYLLTGLLVFEFLKNHFGNVKAFGAAIIFLSLSPINYHFHHHIMFVWYLPFLMMGLIGLDYYFREKKKLLFVGGVFCLILTNYYFSVGSLVCLFVYAIYNILKKEEIQIKDLLQQFWRTVYLFVIPVLLSAFVLLPTAYGLFSNGRTFEVAESIENLYIPNLQDSFFYHFGMGITGTMFVAVMGNLACKKIKKGEVFLNLVLLLLVLCPIFSYVLNGMLYVRGKVLIPFAILFVYAFCSFIKHLEKREVRYGVMIVFTLLFVALTCVADNKNEEVCSYILIGLVATVVFQIKPMLLYLCVITMLLNTSYENQQSEQYVTYESYENLEIEETKNLLESTSDASWYRSNVAWKEHNTANRIYGDNFYGSSIYSSTSNSLYQKFYETYMGNNERYRNCFMTTGARSELFHTLMGTRYMVSANDPGLYYEKIAEGDTLSLYKNKNAYPIVYKSQRTMNVETFDNMTFPYTAECLMKYTVVEGGDITDYQPTIEECDVEEQYKFIQEEASVYQIKLDKSYRGKLLYLTFDIVNQGEYRNKRDVSISINDVKNKLTKSTWQYYNGNTTFDYIISLESDTILTVEITEGRYDVQNLRMYTSPVITEAYCEAEDLKVDEFSSVISCSVKAEDGDYLVTSIPYDKGFKAYVNEEQVEVEVINKAFVGIKLNAGDNQIVIKYVSPFFKVGMLVSFIGLALLMWELLNSNMNKFMKKYREIVMYLIFGGLTTVVSLATYFVCTAFVLDAEHAVQLQIANMISWLVSVTFAYLTNKKYVFQSHNTMSKEAGKFYLSRLSTLVIDMALMYLLVTMLDIDDAMAKIAVQIIVIVINYLLGKFLVFKEEKTNENISCNTML